jgi:hypothetical protein
VSDRHRQVGDGLSLDRSLLLSFVCYFVASSLADLSSFEDQNLTFGSLRVPAGPRPIGRRIRPSCAHRLRPQHEPGFRFGPSLPLTLTFLYLVADDDSSNISDMLVEARHLACSSTGRRPLALRPSYCVSRPVTPSKESSTRWEGTSRLHN